MNPETGERQKLESVRAADPRGESRALVEVVTSAFLPDLADALPDPAPPSALVRKKTRQPAGSMDGTTLAAQPNGR